jgi:hypothetical protein
MINSSALLTDLRRFLLALERDLRTRISEQESLFESLQAEWKDARDAGRTSLTYTDWLDDEITQAAAHWVLGCVYLRFLEDNHFLERPYLAGPDQKWLALARDRHEQYFHVHPIESDREYLISCFRDVAQLPAMRGLFDEQHNPLFRIGLSGDGAMQLLSFWQRIDPDTGLLIHDFSDPESATRFLAMHYCKHLFSWRSSSLIGLLPPPSTSSVTGKFGLSIRRAVRGISFSERSSGSSICGCATSQRAISATSFRWRWMACLALT